MSVLITGGTGFIGAEIVRMLLDRGEDQIHVAHRSGNLGRLTGVEDQVELHQFDLSDLDSVDQLISSVKPDQLIHFGAILTGPGEDDPQALLTANATGFIRTIEAARLAGTQQMIFASSIGTYGRDLDGGPIDDMSLQRPGSVYGVTKVFGENLGAYYRGKYGLDFRSLRYPSIVGPGVTTWSLAQYTSWMIEKPALGEPFAVWTTPEAVIPILYYKDAARAAIELADAPIEQIKGMNYLVDGPRPSPNAGEIAEAVRRQLPDAEITFEPDPDQSRRAGSLRIDDRYARDEWGWEPQYGLDEMITALIEEVG
ncbi:MAG: NAD-dependent epimerase/dehydratase family protein [Actinomycetota bacterium]|jgi:threonine 3-dehydrogenase|nr:NAD-dependent epimerase/dehydratase family protein [Actinomycetota bacterium]